MTKLSEKTADQAYERCSNCRVGYRKICIEHCGGHAIPSFENDYISERILELENQLKKSYQVAEDNWEFRKNVSNELYICAFADEEYPGETAIEDIRELKNSVETLKQYKTTVEALDKLKKLCSEKGIDNLGILFFENTVQVVELRDSGFQISTYFGQPLCGNSVEELAKRIRKPKNPEVIKNKETDDLKKALSDLIFSIENNPRLNSDYAEMRRAKEVLGLSEKSFMKIPFKTSSEQICHLGQIIKSMKLAKLPEDLISSAHEVAQYDQGVYDLMAFWFDSGDEIRKEIITDLRRSLRDWDLKNNEDNHE